MSKFKDNFSSESFYPDSNYYLDQDNAPKKWSKIGQILLKLSVKITQN